MRQTKAAAGVSSGVTGGRPVLTFAAALEVTRPGNSERKNSHLQSPISPTVKNSVLLWPAVIDRRQGNLLHRAYPAIISWSGRDKVQFQIFFTLEILNCGLFDITQEDTKIRSTHGWITVSITVVGEDIDVGTIPA